MHGCMCHQRHGSQGGHGPITFWPSLVAKDRDTLVEQSLTLIEQTFTLIEQSNLIFSFLIVDNCSSLSGYKYIATDFNSCRMARAGGYDLIIIVIFILFFSLQLISA